MKKYIILGWCGGMGGGNIYTKNKCEAARLAGWEPIVIHFSSREVFLKDLKVYQENRIKEMLNPPCFYTGRQQKRIIDRFVNYVNPLPDDEFFVESNGIRNAYWGELLAKRLNCKHFAFVLEFFFPWHDDNTDFLLFKLNRKELSAISTKNMMEMFDNRKDISYDDIPIMHASCSNSVDEAEDTMGVDYSKYDIIIGNIGRSSKPYVESLGVEILKFAKKHSDKKILFIIIGGEQESLIAKQQSVLFQDAPNLDFVNTGFIFPIPQNILNHLDVAIASGGCIGIGVRNGVKTITYADNDTLPYGVMGYDIKDRNLQMIEHCGLSLFDLLEGVLFESYCEKFEYKQLYDSAPTNEQTMNTLLKDIEYMTSAESKEYYDTTKIYPQKFIYKFYISTMGSVVPMSNIISIVNTLGITKRFS